MSYLPAELHKEFRSQFDRYQSLLLKWNEKINLTAITRPEEIQEKHFLDSLAPLAEIVSRETFGRGLRLLDIGAGAGFPGLPLKIVHSKLEVTLVDSIKKKCDFMKEVIRALGLTAIEVLHQTLKGKEDLGRPFDVVISRAAFKLPDFLSLALPHLVSSGRMMIMKSEDVVEEVKQAQPILKREQISLCSVPYTLSHSGLQRQILILERLGTLGELEN